MNIQILIGNLGNDAESRTATSGTKVTEFRMATNEGKDRTEWHQVVCFGKTAELAADLTKGSKIAVFGRKTTEQWEDRDGNKRYTVKTIADRIEFLSPKASSQPKGTQTPDDGVPF